MQKLASECSMIEISLGDKKGLSSRSLQPDLERVASTQIGDPSSNPWLIRHFTESKNVFLQSLSLIYLTRKAFR